MNDEETNLYFDREGLPYVGTLLERVEQWGKDRENKDYKLVKQDELPNGKYVSTVWVGIDHRMDGEGPPLIFETMVFESQSNLMELLVKRYSTEAEALAGHELLCQTWGSR